MLVQGQQSQAVVAVQILVPTTKINSQDERPEIDESSVIDHEESHCMRVASADLLARRNAALHS